MPPGAPARPMRAVPLLAAALLALAAAPSASAAAVSASCKHDPEDPLPFEPDAVEDGHCTVILGLPLGPGFNLDTDCPPDGSGGRACTFDLCLFAPLFPCGVHDETECDVGATVSCRGEVCDDVDHQCYPYGPLP